MTITQHEGVLSLIDDDGNEKELYPEIKTDTTLSAAGKAADSAAVGEALKNISSASTKAYFYTNYSDMITALSAMDSTDIAAGQSVYISTTNVPDLWISSVEASIAKYIYTDDATFLNDLAANTAAQIGYFKVSMIEGRGVDKKPDEIFLKFADWEALPDSKYTDGIKYRITDRGLGADAATTPYNNIASGLGAANVQDAIDILASKISPSSTVLTGGSLIAVSTNISDLEGATVVLTKDGVELDSGVIRNMTCTLFTTEVGRLNVSCGSHYSTLTINYYSKYRVVIGTYHYGFKKAKHVSNPYDRVTYIEDNANFIPAYMNYVADEFNYGSWENAFFMPRPCMLKYNGTVDYYLDPNDVGKKEDGTPSDITDTAYEGNAMMQWPMIYSYRYEDDDYEYIHVSNKKLSDNYTNFSNLDYYGNEIDYFYTPMYNGANVNKTLRSMSGLTPIYSQTGTTEVTYAKANNVNSNGTDFEWYTEVWCDRSLIDDLLILIGKSTDTQSVFGNGHYTGGTAYTSLLMTGTMDDKGMFWGTNEAGAGVKVFGMENYWGNQARRTAGFITSGVNLYVKMTPGTSDGSTVTGYNTTAVTGAINLGKTISGTSGGYISETCTRKYGTFPIKVSGSSSTYECDGSFFSSSNVNYAAFGGYCSNNSLVVGAFHTNLSWTYSGSGWYIGASISCKPFAPGTA